jgi:hypothetical protein
MNEDNRIWVTKDGKHLRWADMSDEHLRNVANFLRRNALDRLSAFYSCGSFFTSDAATYAWECQAPEEDETYQDGIAYAEMIEAYLKKRKQHTSNGVR